MLRTRIDPDGHGVAGLQGCPTHDNFTQPLIVAEEVGSIAEPMPSQERCVAAFRALLYPEHRRAQVTGRQVRSLYADEQHVAALRQQLAQFGADRIRQTLTYRRGVPLIGS